MMSERIERVSCMKGKKEPNWDPKSDWVMKDQIKAYDEMRNSCPVAYSTYLHWSLFQHKDVSAVLHDSIHFSNVVSSNLSVPNGMDPPEHGKYRKIIEPYFNQTRMEVFEPECRKMARELVNSLPANGEVEVVSVLSEQYALLVQCAFLGWTSETHEPLRKWISKNHKATLNQDRKALAAIALEFDGYIQDELNKRRSPESDRYNDLTVSLMQEKVDGRLLTDQEITSILRNWTVGELSTISACVSILCNFLAENPSIQQQLRDQPSLLEAAIDEILRIHPPLIANRRIVSKPVEIDGQKLEIGEKVSLIWASANRDEKVFGDPDIFKLDREPELNLLYGAGIHVCPGAPLARLELVIIMSELLKTCSSITPIHEKCPVKAVYPASGFSSLRLHIKKEVNCSKAS